MAPGTFFEDFERTECTDFLHGVIGRMLILSARFESMCNSLAVAIDLVGAKISASQSEEEFDALVNAAINKYRTTNGNINSLDMPKQVADAMHKARKARNEVAHALPVGLPVCLDTKLDLAVFTENLRPLVEDLVLGDIVISLLVTVFNGDPIPSDSVIESYKSKFWEWVTTEYES